MCGRGSIFGNPPETTKLSIGFMPATFLQLP
jgi:hypothetical protein